MDLDCVQRSCGSYHGTMEKSIIRLHPDAFRTACNELGSFSIDFIASTISAQRPRRSSPTLPFSQSKVARVDQG